MFTVSPSSAFSLSPSTVTVPFSIVSEIIISYFGGGSFSHLSLGAPLFKLYVSAFHAVSPSSV